VKNSTEKEKNGQGMLLEFYFLKDSSLLKHVAVKLEETIMLKTES